MLISCSQLLISIEAMAKGNADSDYGNFLEEIFSSLSMEDEVGSAKPDEMKVLNEISPVEECEDDIGMCETCSKRPAESPVDELTCPLTKRPPDSDLPNNPKRLKKSSCKCKKQLSFNIESESPKNSPEYSTSENDEDNEKLAEPLGLEELNIASLPEGHSIATTSSENEITPEIGASKRKHSADGENWVICKKKSKCLCDCKKQFDQKGIKQELVDDSNCNLNSLDSQSGPQPLSTDTSTGEHKPEDVEGILTLKNDSDKSEDTRIRGSRTEVDKCLGSMKHIKKEMLQLFDLESNSASSSKFNKTTKLECDVSTAGRAARKEGSSWNS